MNKPVTLLVVPLSLLLGYASTAWAQPAPTEADAQAFAKKGVAFFKANGKEKALAAYSDPKGEFVSGELYLTVWDFNGNQIAHGSNQKLIGKNLLDLKDSDGKYFVKEFMEIAKKGSGWVEYKWTNPVSKKIEPKRVYLEAVGDILVGCGVYKK